MKVSGIGVHTNEMLKMCLIPPEDLVQFQISNNMMMKSSYDVIVHMLQLTKPSKKLGGPGIPCLTPAAVWIITPLLLLLDLEHSRFHALASIQDT